MSSSKQICFFLVGSIVVYLTQLLLLNGPADSYMEQGRRSFDLLTQSTPPYCFVPELKSPDQFFKFLDKKVYPCKKLVTVGGKPILAFPDIIDGEKKICLDPAYSFKKGNCTVLSFGTSTDFTFDDEMDKKFKCQVSSFDPSIGFKDHARSSRQRFYDLGLGSYEGIKKFSLFLSKIDRYEGIMYRLGLQNTTIDYLKMDIEGGELDFFDEIFGNSYYLLNKINQIAIEIHPKIVKKIRDSTQSYWSAFHKLECYGFRMVWISPNILPTNLYEDRNGTVRSRCYEMLWAKV